MVNLGTDFESFKAWTVKHKAYVLHHHKMNYTKYGWSEETHFKGFDDMVEGVNFEWGYGCSGVPTAKPHREEYEHVSIQFNFHSLETYSTFTNPIQIDQQSSYLG